MHKLFLSLLVLISFNSYAGLCSKNIEAFPVRNQGRVKPFLVMAEESIKLITGKTSFQNLPATVVTCKLSLESIGIDSDIKLPLRIDHVKIKKLFNIKDNESFISANAAIELKDLVKSEIIKEKKTTSYKKALNKVWFKIDTYEKMIAGEYWQVVNLNMSETVDWVPVKEAFKDKNALEMYDYLKSGTIKYQKLKGDKYLTEVTLVKSHIFSYAMAVAILGIFITVLFKNPLWGMILAWSTIILEIIGMTLRIIISGRAPITNMYETVLFSGFGALTIALIIFIFKKDKIFILGGLGYNILCLFMMKFAHGMLDSAISPLVPVLRDNFWLSTHVTTIMLSYAALALSWLLANITLAKQKFKGISNKDYRYYEDLVYTSVKVGVVLLASGIILGGVWADYSWGRFWGWDPKETWSLIVLLFYMAVLHGKNTSWINTHRFIMFTAAGFMTVMMAWFGVNYILATGLHSYGFSEGGAIFLGSFFALQIIYLIITGFKNKDKQSK